MYFIYLDESGNTGQDLLQRFFVLTALAAQVEHCMSVQQQLADLKLRFFPVVQPEEIEIKGRSLIHGKDFFEHVRLETRQAILHETLDLLRRHPFRLFATVVDKLNPTLLRLNLLPDDVYRYACKNLLQRIDNFLNAQQTQGLVFIDSMASSIRSNLKDARLVQIHREYLQGIAKTKQSSRFVEYPVFVQSQFFAAIQLADVCAYELFQAYQTSPDVNSSATLNPKGDPRLEVILKMLDYSSGLDRLP